MSAGVAAYAGLDRLGPALSQALDDDRWIEATATLVAGGKSNLTFEVECAAGAVILRRPPGGDLLPSAHDMGREARIQRALQGTAVPVARVLLEDDGRLIGAPFYVMEKVIGHSIREHLPSGYAERPEDKVALADGLIDALAALHEVDPDQVGLADFGRPHGYLERQVRRWSDQWSRSKTHDVAAVTELSARLSKQVPTAERTSIVHGDYRLDNCMMDLDDPARVRAVLDWEMSTLGDPLTDLALMLLYWREPSDRRFRLTPAITQAPGFPGRRHLVARYEQKTGRPVENLAFYEAFAHYKFAVIAQGIAARVAADAMAGQQFGDLDAEVRLIAEEGLERLERHERED
ncbi:phosphotransferase family protein [Nocardioides sp. NPDC057577]|uniref:phosphotransferase family protein n=1 Tax=Nocardioides sp. NPDC057577 TaxID=3346171 RepID=UPI00366EDA90